MSEDSIYQQLRTSLATFALLRQQKRYQASSTTP